MLLRMNRHMAARAVPVLCGLGLAALAIGTGRAASTDEPVRCEIQADTAGSMITLQGMVQADEAASGTYRFKVESTGSGGNSDIKQGGSFAVGPDRPATLGRVMLGGGGVVYDASLDVTSNGATVSCSKQVGGRL